MEKAAAGAGAGARWNKLPGRCLALALVAGTAAAPVVAQVQAPASADWLIAQVGPDQQPLRVQVRTSALPRIEAQDSGFQAPRVDVSISPADGHGLSPVLGFSSAAPAPTPAGLQPQRPSLDVGLRQPTYGARVELNLSPVRKSGLALDRGFVGMQLEGGARITIKRKDGRPMVYYRSAF